MKFSVIVPVYNAEKYISQCIESILGQDYSDLELILVDDDSKDKSGEICRKYAAQDSRVIYIHQENAGTSAARNTGLDQASGDYIMFCDNDDFWEGKMVVSDINRLLSESKADVLMFNTATYDMLTGKTEWDQRTLSRNDVVGKYPEDGLKAILNSGLMAVAVWAKVFRRKFIEQNNIRFPVGRRFEDTDFSAQALLYAESYDWYENVFYRYRIHTNEAQTSKPLTKKQLDDLRGILTHYIDLGTALSDKQRYAYYSFLAYPFSVWLGYSVSSKEKNQNEIDSMKEYSRVLRCDANANVRKLSGFYKIFGYKMTGVLLKYWIRKNR